ncbi:MAG: alpha/beta hydrolase [Nitrosomonadales bacterium]|nr:alpha/beta hydrolase [Nitrosomonadales bacterium]
MRIFLATVLIFTLSACGTRAPREAAYYEMDRGNLPAANVTLNIPGLGPCTDNPDRTLRLDAAQPINVLVHGCFGSSGEFRGLAQVLAFHGQQTACFTYDDRDSLTHSATDLRSAVDQLAAQTHATPITVIGHSQGALISRKSLTELPLAPPQHQSELRLVTISGPFDGIASAETCGKKWLYPLTLGLLPASCYVVTGAKWSDITYSSRFIREPGMLIPQVSSYLKIDTDERDSCRREENGRCLENDDVFSLAEQHNPLVENDARAKRVEVKAGHVEIVGNKRVAPTKLIATLQQQGVIRATAPDRLSAFNLLLARIYQDEGLKDRTPR